MTRAFVLSVGDPAPAAHRLGAAAGAVSVVGTDAALTYVEGGSGTPVFSDDFESGDLNGAVGGSWAGSGAASVASVLPRTGTYHMDISCPAGSSNEHRCALDGEYTELWIERWIYIGEEYHHEGSLPDNNKFFSIWGTAYANDNRAKCTVELRPTTPTGDSRFRMMISPNGQGTTFNVGSTEAGGSTTYVPGVGDSGDVLIRGQYTRWRLHIDIGTQAGEGVLQMWVGDTLVFNESGLNIYPTGGSDPFSPFFDNFYLWGATNLDYPVDTTIYEDDIRFYDEDPGW